MHSDLCWEAEEEGRVQHVSVPVLCARESWTGSAPQNPLQVKDFACREKAQLPRRVVGAGQHCRAEHRRICAGAIYSPLGMGYPHFINREIKHGTK